MDDTGNWDYVFDVLPIGILGILIGFGLAMEAMLSITPPTCDNCPYGFGGFMVVAISAIPCFVLLIFLHSALMRDIVQKEIKRSGDTNGRNRP